MSLMGVFLLRLCFLTAIYLRKYVHGKVPHLRKQIYLALVSNYDFIQLDLIETILTLHLYQIF